MAINFGDTIIEGGIEPTVKVQAPVQDDSGAALAGGFKAAANAIGGTLGSIFKGQQDNQKAGILVAYENDLLNLADAVDQGLSTSEAMLKARVLRSKYLANAPALQADFDTVWTDFASATGLGHVLIEGTPEQKNQELLATEAAKLGYQPDEFQLFQSRARQATELNYQLENIKAQGGIITETQKYQAIQSVVGLAQSAFPSAQKQINEAMSAIAANPNDKAAIAANLNMVLGSQISQMKYLAGNADAAYITEPIESLMKTFNDFVNGSVTNTVLEGQIKSIQNTYDLMYATDPTFGPRIAASRMLKAVGMEQQGVQMWDAESVKKLVEASTPNGPTVNVIDEGKGSARFIDNVAQIAGTITPSSSPELVTEVRTSIEQMIDSAYVHERSANGAMSFKDLVNGLGRPEIGEFIKAHGISAKYAEQLTGVLKNNYENELLPAVSRFWSDTDVSDIDTIRFTSTGSTMDVISGPVSQFLEPRWNGNAVEFVPKAEYANNMNIMKLASDVTSGDNSIGIPLNNLINAYANTTGVEASKIWEQDFAGRLFNIGNEEGGGQSSTVQTSPKTEDSFTLGDFNPDTLEPLEEYSTQASALHTELGPFDPAYVNDAGINWDSYLPSIRSAESGGNDSAKNPKSTATGRYQFLTSTWNDLVARYPNTGITKEGRLDASQQEIAIKLFTAENARQLSRSNIPLNNGTLYAAHFLGAGDAVKVLKATEGMVADYVPAKVINANPFLKGMSVEQFKAWANRKGTQ